MISNIAKSLERYIKFVVDQEVSKLLKRQNPTKKSSKRRGRPPKKVQSSQ